MLILCIFNIMRVVTVMYILTCLLLYIVYIQYNVYSYDTVYRVYCNTLCILIIMYIVISYVYDQLYKCCRFCSMRMYVCVCVCVSNEILQLIYMTIYIQTIQDPTSPTFINERYKCIETDMFTSVSVRRPR